MDISTRIQQLEDMVREAKGMPMSASVRINRDEALEVIGAMREDLPEEIKQARWVVKDREELLAKARREAEALIDRARAEQLRLAGEQAVVQRANEEAERIATEAREAARQTRLEAEDYVDGKLAQFEMALAQIRESMGAAQDALGRTVESVGRGREKLRGLTHQAAPEGDEADDVTVAEAAAAGVEEGM